MSNPNCIFCNIANSTLQSATVFENSEYKVILDLYPASKGHTLIIPKEHVESIYDMDSDMAGKVFGFATIVARALKIVLGCDGLNVLQNNGEAAGQTVNHFHMHLIPRFKNDGLKFAWSTIPVEREQLELLAREIGKKV